MGSQITNSPFFSVLILTHLSLCVCECGHATKTEVQHLPSVCAWFPSLIEQQGGKTHFLSDTEEQSPEHKEGLTFCQEFDFSEEDCALNKSVIKRKKKNPHTVDFGVSNQEQAAIPKASL